MDSRLKKIVDKIGDENLRERVAQLLEEPSMEIDGRIYTGLPLDRSPGSVSRHHSYPGGWLEHVVATVKIALTLSDVVKGVYRGRVNTDLVLSGALLHDLFKPLTYVEREDGTYDVSPLAERLDHLTLITSELLRRGFPLSLVHIVGAHYGEYGPMRPRTLEALIVQIADIADSNLNGKVLDAAKFLVKRATEEEIRQISSKDAFEIVRIKAEEGLQEVKKYVMEFLKT